METELEEEESTEHQPVRSVIGPRQPTQAQIDDHEASGHAAYRSWCRFCVSARGIGTQHRSQSEEHGAEDTDPIIYMDYGFINKDGKYVVDEREGEHTVPIIILKDSKWKCYGATTVQQKGPDEEAVKYCVEYCKALGHRRVMIQTDGEPAIRALKSAIIKATENEITVRESPPYDHKANGVAEEAVKEVKRQTRVILYELNSKYGKALDMTSPLAMFIPRHAAATLNRFRRGEDGFTAEIRRTGHAWKRLALPYGEQVHYKPSGKKR